MREKFPLHIMIKPEGLEYFPDYIHDSIQLFERETESEEIFRMITTLTPKQVDLVYPDDNIPEELKKWLSSKNTEHYIIQGVEKIYEMAKTMKGKSDSTLGIRGSLVKLSSEMNLRFEKWQNFIHTSDSLEQTQHICSNLLNPGSGCLFCSIRERCLQESTK